MAGTKRTAAEAGEATPRTTRSSKIAKTDGASPPKSRKPAGKGGKKGPKASVSSKAFTAQALPLHVNITHTPPVITDDDSSVPSGSVDPGRIAAVTLVPSVFSTGSCGWKGSRRVAIELPNPDGGEAKKLQVMITINAAVIGSKDTKENDENEDGKEEAGGESTPEEKDEVGGNEETE